MQSLAISALVRCATTRHAGAADAFTHCLARVVGALDEALVELDNKDAEAQLIRFTKLLCDRCVSRSCEQNDISCTHRNKPKVFL